MSPEGLVSINSRSTAEGSNRGECEPLRFDPELTKYLRMNLTDDLQAKNTGWCKHPESQGLRFACLS